MSLKWLLGGETHPKYYQQQNAQQRIKFKTSQAQLLLRVYNLIIEGHYENYLKNKNFFEILKTYNNNEEYIENEDALNEVAKFIFLQWTKNLCYDNENWNWKMLPKLADFENLVMLQPLKEIIGKDWFQSKTEIKAKPEYLFNYKNAYVLFKELRPDLVTNNNSSNLKLENENLKLKNELAEKELKLKELELKLKKPQQIQ